MIVISDTSVIIYLAQIGYLHLLPSIFPETTIPYAVFREITQSDSNLPGANEVRTAQWISVKTPQDRTLIVALLDEIDLGEAEAIALAIALNADFLLLDERKGRSVADRYKINHLGF